MDGAKNELDGRGGLEGPGAGHGRIWRELPGSKTIWHATVPRQGVPLRATAIRLRDGRTAVFSPIRGCGPEAHRELRRIGEPELLIAPNHFHNLGLPEYVDGYPGSQIVASTTALPRLQRRLRRPVRDETALRAALPPEVTMLVPPGTKAGELWLSAMTAAGRAWIVGDGFFNIARTPRTPMGLLLVALGISSGLRIGSSFRWLLRDRATYRSWLLEQLDRAPPTVLVPCHGEILHDPALPDRLRRLVETRLGG